MSEPGRKPKRGGVGVERWLSGKEHLLRKHEDLHSDPKLDEATHAYSHCTGSAKRQRSLWGLLTTNLAPKQ